MKKFSERTIENLRRISVDTLVARGIVKPAPNYSEQSQRGICCPLCGSGERGGTGAATFDSDNRLYCHACHNADANGHKLSTIDLFAISRNLQHESFGKIVREMADFFGERVEEETIDVPRRFKRRTQTEPPKKKKEPVNPAELELIRADLATSDEGLKKFVESCGGKWRGLPIEILIRHGCKFVAEWIPPKSRVEKKKYTPTERILIPSGDDFYLARFCGSLDDYDGSTRKFVENTQKLNAGSPRLFNADALRHSTPTAPVIAVEGAIDAMSLNFAGFNAVALNAAGNGDLLVDAVADMQEKPYVVIMLDSDETGRKAAPKLYAELINIGVPCCVRFLSDEDSKIDCNQILVENGLDNLRGRLEEIMDSSLAELDAVTRELEERQLHRHDDALIDFLFQGDASDLDFARRFEKFFGVDVRWLTDNKEWMLYERNEHGGGLWRRAGEQNSCLLPRVREMADVMLEFADNKDERELAEKLKRTRKNLSAITMLKSLDSVLITSTDLDNHSELLNVRNGVINLETGTLMTAAPELLLTQQAAAVYNPKCEDTTFAEFFKSVLPDDDTRAAVKSYLGYCLTGDVSAEKFLMIHGKGGNGKGVLLLTLRTLLGDYACELPVDTVLESKSKFADVNGRATTEITPLVNRRAGIVDELPRNARFDVAKINRLTGRDYLPVREMHHEYKDVPPTHKLILTGNFRPQIDDTRDAALLRRLIVVNFAQDFTQNPDVTLKDKLLADSALTGALNVFVTAAVEFYKRGKLLEPSAAMKRAREEFLGENDFIGDFLAEFYEFGTGEDFAVKRKDLIEHLRDERIDAARYRDADLCDMLAKVDGVTYTKDRTKTNIFKGIRRATKQAEQKQNNAKDEFDGDILSSADWTPPPFD